MCPGKPRRRKSAMGDQSIDRERALLRRDGAPDGTGRADAAPDADADRREWCRSPGGGIFAVSRSRAQCS